VPSKGSKHLTDLHSFLAAYPVSFPLTQFVNVRQIVRLPPWSKMAKIRYSRAQFRLSATSEYVNSQDKVERN